MKTESLDFIEFINRSTFDLDTKKLIIRMVTKLNDRWMYLEQKTPTQDKDRDVTDLENELNFRTDEIYSLFSNFKHQTKIINTQRIAKHIGGTHSIRNLDQRVELPEEGFETWVCMNRKCNYYEYRYEEGHSEDK